MRVRDVARHPNVLSGLSIAPLKAAADLDKYLVAARQDVEILEVVVTVERDHHPGRDDRAHDAQLIFVRWGHEFHDGSEDFQRVRTVS